MIEVERRAIVVRSPLPIGFARATSPPPPRHCIYHSGNAMEAEQLLRKYASGTRRFIGINLNEVDLSRSSLLHINLRNASLSVANLSGANLAHANLRGANLNVAKLAGATLSHANLYGVNLNVANLMRCDFKRADLRGTSLIRSEANRANFQEANLSGANLSSAFLKEAGLNRVTATNANLSEANLERAQASGADFAQATMRRTNLRAANLSGSCFHEADLRRACLSGAKLVEADLRNANLRWADLSGTNLAGADLSGAKLSGANLTGANLTGTNLVDTSFVYADLSHARLIGADWRGTDLSGAILTGAKLHGVLRYGLLAESVTCDWVDLSPNGDGSQVRQLTPEEVETFFNAVLPTVQLSIDMAIDLGTQVGLLTMYYHIAKTIEKFRRSPSILVDARRTTLVFELEDDMWLFAVAYLASIPFAEAAAIHDRLDRLLEMLCTKDREQVGASQLRHIQRLRAAFHQTRDIARQATRTNPETRSVTVEPSFLTAPTHLTLTNSDNQILEVYRSAHFGKRSIRDRATAIDESSKPPSSSLPQPPAVFDFVKIAATSHNARPS